MTDELVEHVARAVAPHLEGGREFDQMPPDRLALRKWSREGMCNTNDATQDDALEVACAVIPLIYNAAIEEAAKVAESHDTGDCTREDQEARRIAVAIRHLAKP